MRHELAYGILLLLSLLAAYGLWTLKTHARRRSRHIRVDLSGKRGR